MRLLIAFLIPMVGLYVDLQGEEFEKLISCFLDERSIFSSILGWRFTAIYGALCSIVSSIHSGFFVQLFLARNAIVFFPRKNVLSFSTPIVSDLNRFSRLNSLINQTTFFSLAPRELSSRNNF